MANFDTKAALAELETISEQVIASQSSGSEGRTLANQTKRYAGILSDNADKFSEVSGDATNEIFAMVTKLENYASLVGPVEVTVQWKSEEVQAKIMVLEQFTKLGLLTDDQITVFNGIKSTLAKGPRGPRTEADTVEGRLFARVTIAKNGSRVGSMAANKAQSPGNLANRLGDLFGITDKSSDGYKALKAYANDACINGNTVTIPVEYQAEDGTTVNDEYTLTPTNDEE